MTHFNNIIVLFLCSEEFVTQKNMVKGPYCLSFKKIQPVSSVSPGFIEAQVTNSFNFQPLRLVPAFTIKSVQENTIVLPPPK